MARLLDRLGRRAARLHWLVVVLWVVAIAGVFVASKAADGAYNDSFTIPGAQSQEAADLLERDFPELSGVTASVVFESTSGTLTSGENKRAVDRTIANTAKLDGVVGTPTLTLAPSGEFENEIGFARVQYSGQIQDLPKDAFTQLERAAAPAARAPNLEVSFGGELVDFDNPPPAGNADEIGLFFAVVILVFALGSVLAMGLPVSTALLGLGLGIGSLSLLSAFTDIGTVAPTLGTMIGLGVGIDYSLFVLMRHRNNLADGMEMHASIGRAVATAGQAVLLAGTTVIIALCGLFLSGIPYVGRLGFSAALVVLVMMIAALTLLPALMGLVGRGVVRWHIPGIGPKPQRTTTDHGLGATEVHGRTRYAKLVVRRPWLFAVPILLVLATLAIPARDIRLGETDDGSAPRSSTQRVAYDTLAKGFGPGFNGPLLVAIQLPGRDGRAIAGDVSSALSSKDGITQTLPPEFSDPARPNRSKAAVVVAFPATSPDSKSTEHLIATLRDTTLPEALHGTGAQAYVGGLTAEFIDLGHKIQDGLPVFIVFVMGLSLLLMLVVFRSVLAGATASLLNLLSVAAAYGVITAVFQQNIGASIIGVDQSMPIVSFVPLMLFAILFGLSMDYQVFFLSGVREEYSRSADSRRAVIFGLAGSARVITSAALIMFTVFASFIVNPTPVVKMFGLGLAIAVLFDAVIVLGLMPALMTVYGRAGWWIPRWLDRVLPRLEIDSRSRRSPSLAGDPRGGTDVAGDDVPEREPV